MNPYDDDETLEQRRRREKHEAWAARSHTYTARLFKIGAPTVNGHVYSREVVEDMVRQFKERHKDLLGGVMPDSGSNYLDLRDVTHKVDDLRIDGDDLVCQVTFLEGLGEVQEEVFKHGGVFLTTAIEGCLDKDNSVVGPVKLRHVSLVPGKNPNYSMGCHVKEDDESD